MKIFEGKKVPIKSWCNNPEEGAVDQAKNLASLPFIFKHVALMPGVHQGYGMPIECVIATKDVVIPNAVGADIGCGMCAVKTSLTNIPKFKGEDGLAFLPLNTKEGQDYLEAMNYAVEFALANRELMMTRIINIFCSNGLSFMPDCTINIAHNYARMEHHYGQNVMVHRKGATSAKEGEIGIIPGSQGTSSYIVEGLGNPESFKSWSHGAGRKMSRTKAINELSLEEEQQKLESQGIIHSIRTKKQLDEASGAYKPIEEVMSEQKDLVEIIVKLQPLGVIKG